MPIALASVLLLLFQGTGAPVPRIDANSNESPAGTLSRGVLRVRLEVQVGRWYPKSDSGPSEMIPAFAEVGRAPSVPGPLIRVRTGTRIEASIRNTLGEPLILYGLHSRPGRESDTVQIAPGAERTVRFDAGAPGTYFYWGTSTGSSMETRDGVDSQLSGAIVVDSATATDSPRDRVFVMGAWHLPRDTTGPKPWVERDEMVINGKSWPHTERFSFTVGDTVRWRWANPTADAHPMHLHGFYYSVDTHGTWARDTIYSRDARRSVVTEMMLPGQTMSATWVPRTVGNWLFHCHFAFHVSHYLSLEKVADPVDPGAPDAVDHSVHGMAGLILGIAVRPRGGVAPSQTSTVGAGAAGSRAIRLLAQAAPARYAPAPGYGFVAQDVPVTIPRDSVPVMSPTLVLRRGEPARITVVNHLRAPTAVHWHGIELSESYYDGVPGWSGAGARLASAIAPNDSFVVEMTPPRAGTFIYHSHSNEGHQISSGLYGALIVVDGGRTLDNETDRVFVVGANGADDKHGRINGQLAPAEQVLEVGRTYRFRIVQINPDFRVFVSVKADSAVQQWRAVAKDGAELPRQQAIISRSRILMGPGETADFEMTPTAVGRLRLEVATQIEGWTTSLPFRVRRP